LTGEGQAALDALLTSHDATITVERVTFRGAMESKRMGIHLSGAPDKQPLVDQCVFGSLAVGMQIDGALPLVRRCFFDHLTVTGIRFEEGAGSKADAATSFSDETDANTGYNTFNGYDNEKKAVINNRSSEITMPNNDWGTDDAAAISNMTQGVGAVPALAAGSGLIPASMYCSVWNAKTKSYLSNASVAVTPGSLKAMSSSQNGIYPFVCLPAGSYTVEVTAEGFRSGRVNVSLGGGQQKVLNIPVSDLTALGCSGKDEPSQVRASITSGMGNIGLYMMVGLLLTVAALRRRDVSR
jgi:hypothetical protein